MVDRLKDEPFALLGMNSDGDRKIASNLANDELLAIRGLKMPDDRVFDSIRRGDAKVLEQLGAAGAGLRKKVFEADRANLNSVLKKNKITWRQHVMGTTSGALAQKWNVQSWPTIYILDAKGVIRHKDLRDEELEKAVVDLIAEAKEQKGH